MQSAPGRLRAPHGLYPPPPAVLSNNHINVLLGAPFDTRDEELLAYHVSLIKALSLRLNESTVFFFYNARAGKTAFPLYVQALRYYAHPDGMVQTAVRTTVLNVCRVPEPSVRAFITSGPRLHFWDRLAWTAAAHVVNMNQRLAELMAASKGWELRFHTATGTAGDGGGPVGPPPPPLIGTCAHYTLRAFSTRQGAAAAMSTAMSAIGDSAQSLSDLLFFIGDVLSLDIPTLSKVLTSALMRRLVRPLLLHSLAGAHAIISARMHKAPAAQAAASPRGKGHLPRLRSMAAFHGLQVTALAAAADGVPAKVRTCPDVAAPWLDAGSRAAAASAAGGAAQFSAHPVGMAPPPPTRALVLDSALTLSVLTQLLHACPMPALGEPLAEAVLNEPLRPQGQWTQEACVAAAQGASGRPPAEWVAGEPGRDDVRVTLPPLQHPVTIAFNYSAGRQSRQDDGSGGGGGEEGSSVSRSLFGDEGGSGGRSTPRHRASGSGGSSTQEAMGGHSVGSQHMTEPAATGRDVLLQLMRLPDSRVASAATGLLWMLAHSGGDGGLAGSAAGPAEDGGEEEGAAMLSPRAMQSPLGAVLTGVVRDRVPFYPSPWSNAADAGDVRCVAMRTLQEAGLHWRGRSRAGLLLTSLTQEASSGEAGSTPKAAGAAPADAPVEATPQQVTVQAADDPLSGPVQSDVALPEPPPPLSSPPHRSRSQSAGVAAHGSSPADSDGGLRHRAATDGAEPSGSAALQAHSVGAGEEGCGAGLATGGASFATGTSMGSAVEGAVEGVLGDEASPRASAATSSANEDDASTVGEWGVRPFVEGASVYSLGGGSRADGTSTLGGRSECSFRLPSLPRGPSRPGRMALSSLVAATAKVYEGVDGARQQVLDALLASLTLVQRQQRRRSDALASLAGMPGAGRRLHAPPPPGPFAASRHIVSAISRLTLPASLDTAVHVARLHRAGAVLAGLLAAARGDSRRPSNPSLRSPGRGTATSLGTLSVGSPLAASMPAQSPSSTAGTPGVAPLPEKFAPAVAVLREEVAAASASSAPSPPLVRAQVHALLHAVCVSTGFLRNVLRHPELVGGVPNFMLLLDWAVASYLESKEYSDATAALHCVTPLARAVASAHATAASMGRAGPELDLQSVDLVSVPVEVQALSPATIPMLVSSAPGASTAAPELWQHSLVKQAQSSTALWAWCEQGVVRYTGARGAARLPLPQTASKRSPVRVPSPTKPLEAQAGEATAGDAAEAVATAVLADAFSPRAEQPPPAQPPRPGGLGQSPKRPWEAHMRSTAPAPSPLSPGDSAARMLEQGKAAYAARVSIVDLMRQVPLGNRCAASPQEAVLVHASRLLLYRQLLLVTLGQGRVWWEPGAVQHMLTALGGASTALPFPTPLGRWHNPSGPMPSRRTHAIPDAGELAAHLQSAVDAAVTTDASPRSLASTTSTSTARHPHRRMFSRVKAGTASDAGSTGGSRGQAPPPHERAASWAGSFSSRPRAGSDGTAASVDTAGVAESAPPAKVILGDSLLAGLSHGPGTPTEGDAVDVSTMYATRVLVVVEALLPPPGMRVGDGGGRDAGGAVGDVPGPRIVVLGKVSPALQLVLGLTAEHLILIKPGKPAQPAPARAPGGHLRNPHHNAFARRRTGSGGAAAAKNSTEQQWIALSVLPLHLLSVRWHENAPRCLELHCPGLGHVPLMGHLRSSAFSIVRDFACTVECGGPEAALTLLRRLQHAASAALARRHSSIVRLVSDAEYIAASDICVDAHGVAERWLQAGLGEALEHAA